MYTYKVSNGIQFYNTPWFCCGLLTDNVENLPNIFLKGDKQKQKIISITQFKYASKLFYQFENHLTSCN